MSDSLQMRVLKVLAGAEALEIRKVIRAADCTTGDLESIARAGLVRIPDISRGGHWICITPKGIEHLQRVSRPRYEDIWR